MTDGSVGTDRPTAQEPPTLMPLQEAVEILTGPGGEFEPIMVEINGVLTKTWGGCFGSLAEVLEHSRSFAERDFLVYVDRDESETRLTFAQHYADVCALAHTLIDEFDLGKGDRIAVAARNLPEWSVAFFAAASIGAVVVPLNAWWTGAEMVYGLSDSGTRLLIADEERLTRLAPHLAAGEVTLDAGIALRSNGDLPAGWHHYREVLDRSSNREALPAVDIAPDDDATIFYTSGTTGYPKGALGTQRNICSNQRAAEYLKRRGEVRSGILVDPDAQPATLLSVPMFHVTGCHSTLLPVMASGGKLVLTYKFDAEQTVRLIEQEKVTTFGGVPTLVWRVLQASNFDECDLSSVVRVAYGGAPAAPELVRRIQEAFPQAAPSNGYGLTETSAITSTNAGPEYVAKPDSAGVPLPVCGIKVCDEEGNALAQGEIGELWISGPNVIKGYWNKPEATAETFVDGWLRSGDLARIDEDGFITICDRAKDMVIRGGENIYCAEVEAACQEHPDVASVAVYGVAEQILGEEVAATVQVQEGAAALDGQSLRAFCSERIAGFKVPTVWEFISEPLPLNANGKVLKRELRERAETRRPDVG